MKTLIFIALGGVIGSVARYGAHVFFARYTGTHFPWSTLSVNVLGSLAIGYIIGYGLYHSDISQTTKAFLIIGVLGSFTTFSAFSLDMVTLLQKGALFQAGFYLAGSVLLSILAVMVGIGLAKIGGVA